MSNSYPSRGRAAPLNHSVYSLFTKTLGLNDSDFASLMKRGLKADQIKLAGYASKSHHKSNSVTAAIGKCCNEFNIEGVPGFYTDDKTGHWDCAKIQGIYLPVRDIEGNISSLLVRNANPKEKNGKVENKYMAFSSAGKPKGGKVWQTTHCPNIKGKSKEVCGNDIRITEGVLKADVATALGDIYCIGIQGLKVHDDLETILTELEVATVHICLDQGEEANADIIRCRGELIEKINKIGLDCVVELWDEKLGKGIDDVLANGHGEKIIAASEAEIEKYLDLANRKNPNNGEWLYIVSAERFMNKATQQELKKSQFADKFQMVDSSWVNEMIAAGFPQADSITFYPGHEQLVMDNKLLCYNTWLDPQIAPEAGDVSPFLQHMEYLIKEEFDRNVLLDFMAYNIKFPGKKILWAVLCQGNQGIGKSYIAAVMKLLLGHHNVSSPSNESLHEPYTEWQKHASLVVVEEIMARGRMELMNKLKPMITQDTTQVREMYKAAYEQPNRFNFLLFTNHEDAIIIDKDDRRYFVVKSEAKLKEIEYYEKLWDWTRDKNNIAAMMNFMLTRDLSKFKANGKAPETKAKKELIEISRQPLEEWISNNIREENWPFVSDLVAVRHLKDFKVCPSGFERISDYKWAMALRNVGAKPYPHQVKLSDGSKKTIWMLRRHEMYEFESTDIIKQQYEKNLVNKEPGGNPLMDMKPM